MKKILIPISIILGIAAGVFMFAASRGQAEADNGFSLVREAGSVRYKESADQDYADMPADEISLPAGSFVQTSEGAFARIFLPDNSLISLSENTEVQVVWDDSTVSIQQLVGKTWNRVQSVTSGGEFTVETPSAVAAVRGTIFGVDVIDSETSVYVTEGDVDVTRFLLREGVKRPDQTISLTGNEHADVLPEGQLQKRPVRDDEKTRLWFRRNRAIDQIFERLRSEDPVNLRRRLMLELSDFEARGRNAF
ncbi:MAG: FecR protein [candidate division WS6 bacterium OLB20]|uniref:FecR protein n=1 Tax=candidate division WS6 bacterium OLB20 TaxID=1617426 RepID=A0A136M170_9BACT|nr:MAG: FecR protein [candidate division WS6 bacterium OLB20]